MTLDTPESIAAAVQPPPGFRDTFRLVRAADQLDVEVELLNLVPERTGETFLLRRSGDASLPAKIAITLPPQHILEYASGKPSRRIVADPTRLAFHVAEGQDGIPFSTEGILTALPKLQPFLTAGLDFPQPQIVSGEPTSEVFHSSFELVRSAMAGFVSFDAPETRRRFPADSHLVDLALRSTAQIDSGAVAAIAAPVAAPVTAPIGPPSQFRHTELRISSRLVFSLLFNTARFLHAAHPVTHKDGTELWHTRLATLGSDGKLLESTFLVALRSEVPTGTLAGWVTDVVPSKIRALSVVEASQIASLAGLGGNNVLRAKRVHLTPHGATMEVRGDWPNSNTIKSWRHRTAIGRDQYERIVQLGRLYPFGHLAMKTTITEREIIYPPNGSPARLLSRTVVEVLEPIKDFGSEDSIGRQFPFSKIELLSLETPEGIFESLQGDAGIVKVGTGGLAKPFRYRCLALDRAGRPVTFDVPLVFVPNTFSEFTTLATNYKNRLDLSQVRFGGQTLAIAAPGPSGLTAAATPPDATDIIASFANLQAAGSGAGFRPVVGEFTARVPGIERFTALKEQLKLTYEQSTYLTNGFGAGNPGEVLLKIVSTNPVLGLAEETVNGGLLSGISFPVTGLSRRLGPVGGNLADVAKDVFNPKQWLGGLLDELTLLGIVPLKSLIKDVATLAEAPIIAQSMIDGLRTQTMRWSTPLFPTEKFPSGQPQEIVVPGGFARLRPSNAGPPVLNVEAVVVAAENGTMTATTTCTIQHVALGIGLGPLDLVQIPFEKISFISVNGRKPDLDVEMGGITFHGILAFLGVLSRLIDKSGFHDPPALDITADGIRSSFSTPIPNVAVGIFSLENIAFGAALDVSFKGEAPELFLNFATFDNPFRLTVSALGGGGYLGIALSASSGLVLLEGSLEFGAAISINLVVAKGAVSAMGGIYFRIEAGEAILTGYLRIAGILSVLGLISVSVEFLLALSYETEPNIVRGKAEMAIKVSVLFFSKTVRIKLERSFAGASADPTFAELMDPPKTNGPRPWDSYCLAYTA